MIFQVIYSGLGPRVVAASLSSSGRREGPHPGQDAVPSQGALMHTLILSQMGHFGHTNSLTIFGMWEETRVHGENVQIPHTMPLAGN